MNRTFLALALCAAVGIVGMALARHDEKDTAKVTDLSRRDIVEKLDGRDARVTVQEVAIEPGGPRAVQRQGTLGPDNSNRRNNAWNRMAISFRDLPGGYQPGQFNHLLERQAH